MSRSLNIACAATAAAALSFAFLSNSSAQAATKAGCTSKPYAYAGLIADAPAAGIRATVTAVSAARLASGHVAGWIGVGGPEAGPNGEPMWLQVGLNATDDGKAELYGELWKPGTGHVYKPLGQVEVGRSYRLAIVEVAPSTWQVYLDGKPASKRHLLPGSHGAWQPMAMTESWNQSQAGCNAFTYRFQQVQVRASSWTPLTRASRLVDAGYRLTQSRTLAGFTAGSAL